MRFRSCRPKPPANPSGAPRSRALRVLRACALAAAISIPLAGASELPDLGDVSRGVLSVAQERQIGIEVMREVRNDRPLAVIPAPRIDARHAANGGLGTIGATPAVVNAVIDALDHAGLGAAAEAIQMPVTAERVWRALNLKTFDPSPFKL